MYRIIGLFALSIFIASGARADDAPIKSVGAVKECMGGPLVDSHGDPNYWIRCFAECPQESRVISGSCEAGNTFGVEIAIESFGVRELVRDGKRISGWQCDYVDTHRIANGPAHPAMTSIKISAKASCLSQ